MSIIAQYQKKKEKSVLFVIVKRNIFFKNVISVM